MAGSNRLLKSKYIKVQKGAVRIPEGQVLRRHHKEATARTRAKPEVDFVRAQNGTVQFITVRCTCGRDMTLECEYLQDGGQDGQENS